MPSHCAVTGCSNSSRHKKLRQDLVHHTFPVKNPALLKRWMHFCRRKDHFDPKTGRICSDHFDSDAYERDLQHELLGLPPRKKLKMDSSPTIFNPQQVPLPSSGRLERIQKRSNKKLVDECLADQLQIVPEVATVETISVDNLTVNTEPKQTVNLSAHLEDRISVLDNVVQNLTKQLAEKEQTILMLRSKIAKLKSRKSCGVNCKRTSIPLTTAQQQRMKGKRVTWKTEDIVRALTVRSVGLKAYETARKYWQLPLPCVRTLQRWAANFSVDEGILKEVLHVMKTEAMTMPTFKKVCALSFDEMTIQSDFVYDKSQDRIRTNSKAQVVMVRGLFDSWKQPIFYDFDRKLDKDTLFTIINCLEAIDFRVVSITSDLGPENRSLWKSLGVNENNVNFKNPYDEEREVFVFADVPHMIKLLRNHLLDDGVILEDGTTISKTTFLDLINSDNAEIKLCPNLNMDLVNISGAERMRVRPAVRLLSNRVALLAKERFKNDPSISDFIKTVNDSFDVLDSRVPLNDKNTLKSGYGMKISAQKPTLERFANIISSCRFLLHGKQRKSLVPFQIGFLVSIRSTMGLFEALRQQYGITYILTSRLNQDALESLFSSIRAYGGPNQNPTPIEFKYRLRLILLGSNLRPPRGTNVDYEDNTNIMSANLLQKNKLLSDGPYTETSTKVIRIPNLPEDDVRDEDALHYLAGYIAWKIKRLGKGIYGLPTAHRVNTTWIASVSRGGLLTPEPYFYDWIKTCNTCFKSLEGSGFFNNTSKSFMEKIAESHPSIPSDVAKEFISLRLKIRTKFLNTHKGIKSSKINQKKAKQFARGKKNI